MKNAKLFSLLVTTTILAYGAIGFYFLPLATFEGELTRMALLPEAQFGWTKPQPKIDIKLMQQAAMKDADVLIIGDSFSESRLWQTALTKRDLKVRTESWESMRGICEDFTPWLRAQGFKGKYLIIESIERNLVSDLAKSKACEKMVYHLLATTDMQHYPPHASFDVHQGSYSGKLSTGIETRYHAWQYEKLSGNSDFKSWQLPNEVTMARVPDGCQLFSHASCEDALFLSYDKPEEIANEALENIALLNTRLQGFTTIWVFVPNKTTAYLHNDKQFWQKAHARFNAPDLLAMTQQAIREKTIDLYPANNTHFSPTGYLMMGEAIYQAMQTAR